MSDIFIRRNVWDLSTEAEPWDPVSLAYARAVKEMQSRPPDDPTSWRYQANIHNTPDPGQDPHWRQCPHGEPVFFPWHRIYLYWFERIVRSIVVAQGGPAEWALPYWNYSDVAEQAKLPPAFRQPKLPDGSDNPLHRPSPLRSDWVGQGNPLSEATVAYSAAFDQVDFAGEAGFWELIEIAPHGAVHDEVGGPTPDETCGRALMSRIWCAARDPIFWLHHSNIDRLWKAWLRLGEGRANPSDPDWLSQTYLMFDQDRNETKMSVADVLDEVTQLGYRYDDDPPAAPAPAMATAAARSRPAVIIGSTVGPQLTGSRATVSAELTADPAPPSADAPTGPAPRLILRLEGIELERSPGVLYAVFLNLPEAEEATAHHSPHYVGILSFFGLHGHEHGHEQGHGGIRRSYDITKVVNRLRDEGGWDGKTVSVTFVPRPGMPLPDNLPAVHIGGVSIVSF
jgi:tyrosinase